MQNSDLRLGIILGFGAEAARTDDDNKNAPQIRHEPRELMAAIKNMLASGRLPFWPIAIGMAPAVSCTSKASKRIRPETTMLSRKLQKLLDQTQRHFRALVEQGLNGANFV